MIGVGNGGLSTAPSSSSLIALLPPFDDVETDKYILPLGNDNSSFIIGVAAVVVSIHVDVIPAYVG